MQNKKQKSFQYKTNITIYLRMVSTEDKKEIYLDGARLCNVYVASVISTTGTRRGRTNNGYLRVESPIPARNKAYLAVPLSTKLTKEGRIRMAH